MQKESRRRGKWRNVVFGCVALIILVADQLSKTWIRANLAPGESLLDTGLFRIIHIQNSGAAFGILKDYTQILIVVAFIGIAVILLYVFYLQRRWHILDNMFVMGALGLVLGGAIGNQVDRLFRGQVTDFVDFRVWPAFNVADASETVGIIIIVIYILLQVKTTGQSE